MCKSRAPLLLDTNQLRKTIMALLIPGLSMPLLGAFDRLKVPTMGHVITKAKGLPRNGAFNSLVRYRESIG